MSKSLFDELLAGMGDAITDIREKVVEEPWFGRAVTDGQGTTPDMSTQAGAPMAQPSPNAWQEFVQASKAPDSRDAMQPQEPDIDR